MKTHNIYTRIVPAIIAIIFLLSASGIKAQDTKIAVIVNPENPISEMSEGTAKLYYLRKVKKRWPEINKSIKPVDSKEDTKERAAFLSQVLKMNADDVDQYFIERKISNAEAPPVKLNSDEEIIEYVSQNIGAIGFINKANVSNKVKVIYSTP